TTDTKLRKVDTSARRTETSVRALDRTLSRVNSNGLTKVSSKLDSFAGTLGSVPALAIAGTSALIPLGTAAAGVAARLAAPVTFVGGGLTLFGVLGGFAIKDTQDQYKAIDTLQKKLAGLSKGTQAYAQTQHQLQVAQAALSPQQRAFHNSLETL